MTDSDTRVAIYARVSTQEQAVEGTSLDHQIDQLKRYCEAQGWLVASEYVDPGHTGKNDDRPGLKRMMADAKIGLFGKVLVYKLDRLSRNLRLLLELEEKLKSYDIGLHSVRESLDTSKAIGRTVFQVLGLVGEWEREAIIERTKSGRMQRYREGRWAGGRCAYGYAYDRETKKLVVNTKEARLIRRIFELYVDGRSLSNIATAFNKEKVKPLRSNSKGWRSVGIRNVIMNPMYKGTQIVNRHDHISNIDKVDMTKAIIIKVPPIVSEKVWQTAQDRFIANKNVRPIMKRNWLLQGIVKCGICGLTFKSEGHSKLRYYSCRGKLSQNHVDGSPRCDSPRFRADWLEKEVWERIKEVISDPNKLKPILAQTITSLRSREEDVRARIMPIDDQLMEITYRKARLAEDWVIRNMEADHYKEVQHDLDREEVRLKAIRSSIDPAQIEELETTRSILSFWERQLESIGWNLEDDDGQMVRTVDMPHDFALTILDVDSREMSDLLQFPTMKRELLDKLQVKLVVFHDRIEINAVFPINPIIRQKCTSTSQWEGERKRKRGVAPLRHPY